MEGSGGGGAGGGGVAGGLNAHYGRGAPAGGGGFATTAPLGAPQFAATLGEAGGKYFSGLQESAADAPNRVYALQQMLPLVNGKTEFGPGTGAAEKVAGIINGIAKGAGFNASFNNSNVTNINEFNKFAAQYGARAAQDLGLGGSDARIAMTVAATPNGHMTNDALRRVIPVMIGLENAKQGMANAGAVYAQARHGANAQAGFLTQWRQAYDPTIYQMMAMPASDAAAAYLRLPPPQRAALAKKSQALAAMGAFAQ